jgi:hypothetical protein
MSRSHGKPSNVQGVAEKANRPAASKLRPTEANKELLERLKAQGMSKGAMAAERASAGIGTDDRDPDNWFRPTGRR